MTMEAPTLELAPLMRVNQVARRLSLSRTKTYQLLVDGDLPSVTIGKSRRVHPEDLERFITEHNTRR
jgi:excisionase family DNA binding protein